MTDQTTRLPIRRALISVSDKTGILEFAKELEALGVEILSTGGTFKLLQEADTFTAGQWQAALSRQAGLPAPLSHRPHRAGSRP